MRSLKYAFKTMQSLNFFKVTKTLDLSAQKKEIKI